MGFNNIFVYAAVSSSAYCCFVLWPWAQRARTGQFVLCVREEKWTGVSSNMATNFVYANGNINAVLSYGLSHPPATGISDNCRYSVFIFFLVYWNSIQIQSDFEGQIVDSSVLRCSMSMNTFHCPMYIIAIHSVHINNQDEHFSISHIWLGANICIWPVELSSIYHFHHSWPRHPPTFLINTTQRNIICGLLN